MQRVLASVCAWLVVAVLLPQPAADASRAQQAEAQAADASGRMPASQPELSAVEGAELVASLDRSAGWVAIAPRAVSSSRASSWAFEADTSYRPWVPDRRHDIRRVRGGLLLPSSEDAASAAG